MGEPEILGAKEVAEYLHVHLFTVHRLAREGRLPAFKIGADWRFRRDSLERWIEDQERLMHRHKRIRTKDHSTP